MTKFLSPSQSCGCCHELPSRQLSLPNLVPGASVRVTRETHVYCPESSAQHSTDADPFYLNLLERVIKDNVERQASGFWKTKRMIFNPAQTAKHLGDKCFCGWLRSL